VNAIGDPDRRLVRLSWLLGAAGLLVFAVNVIVVRRFVIDDTYITLRYSRNVARGIGAVYNATGERAEGYTSLVWMLVLVFPHLFLVSAIAFAKVLGVAATCATAVLVGTWTWSEVSESRGRTLAAAAAVAGYVALPRTAVHAVSGMETALFTLVLTAAFFASGRIVRDGSRWVMPFCALSVVASLTRPEAAMSTFVAGITAYVLSPRPVRRVLVRRFICVVAIPLVLYEGLRLWYYGLPMPLPFYVKVSSPGAFAGLTRVLEWARSLLRFGVPLYFALRGLPRHLRPVLVAALALIFFFVFPQHLMGYSSRYLTPVDPTVCVLFGLGIARLWGWAKRVLQDEQPPDRAGQGPVRAVVVVALALAALGVSVTESKAELQEPIDYEKGLANAHESLGRDLAALGRPDARLAISDAGAVPYLSGLWTLDLVGLNDAHIAVAGRCDPGWVLANAPDVLVLVSTDAQRFTPDSWNAGELAIYRAATSAGFDKVDLRHFADDYFLWVLARGKMAEAIRGL
jgi:arabinofuranosyltransferase